MSAVRVKRSARQERVAKWVVDTFGERCQTSVMERLSRFLEEAIELGQALAMPAESVVTLVEYVYGRPAGKADQEIGGVGVTLLALCESLGVDADKLEAAEFKRVLGEKPEDARRALSLLRDTEALPALKALLEDAANRE